MPKLVALENVQGLIRHPQWQLVVQLYKLAGYRLIMAQTEQAPVIPSNRPRSAIIFARSDVHIGLGEQEILTRMTLQPIKPRTLKAWKSIACSLPDDILGELVLDEERLGIAMNPKFLPNWQRSPYMNQEKIRQLREINQEDRLGPLMASYAANLSFAAEFLESRGLFIQLVSDCKGHFCTPVSWQVLWACRTQWCCHRTSLPPIGSWAISLCLPTHPCKFPG